GAFAFVFVFAFVGAFTFVGAFAFALAGAFAFAGAVAVAGAVAFTFVGTVARAGAFAFAGAVVVIVAEVLLSAYIAWQAMKGDEKYVMIRNTSVAFAAFGGTSFGSADLTDANFTDTTLKSTDFRKAILTRTSFHKTKKLDRVRPGLTYLQNSQVRQLLVTGQGQDKNFAGLDLRGINLKKANLADASFIGADLSEANLQDADLSRAKLKQTQLDGTDLTGATLTGAYIEDWGITNTTKLHGVRCKYVFMRLPTAYDPDPLRKPDNKQEIFASGEFGHFIKATFDTLDLYHSQGVDPRAIAISFKQLAENHPDAELEIVAMEKRGEDKFLLRAKTAAVADKSELSAEYFDTYNEIKGLPEWEIKLLLEEKDSRIRSLETMVVTALERPSFYSNTQVGQLGTMTNNQGGLSVGGSVGGNLNNVQGDGNRAVLGDNNQAVLGDNNQVTQKNQVGADTGTPLTKDDVVKLLAELETLIQGAELPANTKEEVIEDLSAAKKATDKEEPNKQRALDRLVTVAETLDKTSKGIEGGQKIWTIAKPIIVKVATWLGAAAGSHLLGL
ncbi:MAG: pentapeptide repeat-containing protein, partial [Nostoc sp.]|uniref:pentapeptide repeat-containing protein n=1 Tax=Nostoc sp. TaxID=1180 RepID=UPI002FF94A2E